MFVNGFEAITGVLFATFPMADIVVCIAGLRAGTGIWGGVGYIFMFL